MWIKCDISYILKSNRKNYNLSNHESTTAVPMNVNTLDGCRDFCLSLFSSFVVYLFNNFFSLISFYNLQSLLKKTLHMNQKKKKNSNRWHKSCKEIFYLFFDWDYFIHQCFFFFFFNCRKLIRYYSAVNPPNLSATYIITVECGQ